MRTTRPRQQPHHRHKSLQVLVADKSAHFRETVRRVLCQMKGCDVAGEAATVTELVDQVATSQVDLVLLDIDLVAEHRLGELTDLAARLPKITVAVLLSHDTPEYRQAVERHGGHFSVAKERLEDQLRFVLKMLQPS